MKTTIVAMLVLIPVSGFGLDSSKLSELEVNFQEGRSLKDEGWNEKVYNKKNVWKIIKAPNDSVLQCISDRSASMQHYPITYNAKDYPVLRWQWKVISLPRKRDENIAKNDDYGARLYVFFPGLSFLTSHVLEYVWDNNNPVDTIKTSPSSGSCKLIVVASGREKLGQWVTVRRNLVEDYTRAFGKPPTRKVGAIGFMTDSDNSASRAEAYYGHVYIQKR